MPVFNSFTSEQFWEHYNELPKRIQLLADKGYELFKINPAHPSFKFKKVGHKEQIYSVRVTDNYRALCLKQRNNLYWFWIGDHKSYEKLIREA